MSQSSLGHPVTIACLLAYSSRFKGPAEGQAVPPRRSWAGQKIRELFETKHWARSGLLFMVLLMTALVLGDAVLTPAISVLGAVYGIQVKKPNVDQGTVVGVSCAILIIFFIAQRFGTNRLGAAFAPIMILWFLFNLIVNIYNINTYYPGIFKACSPHHIYLYFKHLRHTGWEYLAGIFLCMTGAEATFADLGHFSRLAIQIAFIGVAYPCLIITYFGQTAYLMVFPENVGTTFFSSIPFGDGFYWVFFVIAAAAAIVASQTLISAAFSILRQSMALGCFPRLTVMHTSHKIEGQIYLPEANFIIMVLTILAVAIFQTTVQLGNAFGVAVSAMMFGTTCLFTLVIIMVWDAPLIFALGFFIFFGFIDMVYLTANLTKVPHGGWLTIAIAGGVCSFSFIWHRGMWMKHTFESGHERKLSDLLSLGQRDDESSAPPADTDVAFLETGETLKRTSGMALFYNEGVFGTPSSLRSYLAQFQSLPGATILLNIRRVAIPTIGADERYLLVPTVYPGVLRVVVRYSYSDLVKHDEAFVAAIVEAAATVPGFAKRLENAKRTTYIVTTPHLCIENAWSARRIVDTLVIETAYNTIAKHLARKPWQDWHLPPNNIWESHCEYAL